jgi:hypothetical protein
MKEPFQSPRSLVMLLVPLAIAGVLAGYYWPDANARGRSSGSDESLLSQRHEFALSSFDIKGTLEAPRLVCDDEGRIHLVFASQTGDGERTLLLASSPDGGATFGQPRAVQQSPIVVTVSAMKGKEVRRPLRMLPHLAVSRDALHLAWNQATDDRQSVRMVLATSTDGGASFEAPRPIHASDAGRPNFTSLAANDRGLVACGWLDNRDRSPQPYAAVRLPDEQFREARLTPTERVEGVCPCCPTAIAVASDGTTFFAFRNVVDGYRDIVISRLRPGESRWEGPFAVVEPTWQFDGCPHDGPSLAIFGDTLYVGWMDGRTSVPRVYLGQANIHDMQFKSRPIHRDAIGSQGNGKLAVDANGRLHLAWDESLIAESPDQKAHHHSHGDDAPKTPGSGRAIMYACLGASGEQLVSPRTIDLQPGAFQTRPAIACLPDGDVVVAFNELDEAGKRIVVERVRGAP